MDRDRWEHAKLGSIISRLDSGVSVNGEDRPVRAGEPGVLKVSAVSGGYFFPNENKAILPEERSKAVLSPRKGDILISRSNTLDLVGACGYVEDDYPNLFLPDKLWRVVYREAGRDHPRWLLHVLNSPAVRAVLKARATGTSGSMKNISKPAFLNIGVDRPPFDEQVSIARILDCWTTAEDSLQRLVVLKQRLVKGLGEQLLTGKRRSPGFADHPWGPRAFGTFLSESRVPGSNGAEARKLSVRLYGLGVYAKKDPRRGSTATQYYTRRAGQFVYSKLDFLNGAFGIIPADLDGYESTLDLPAFDIKDSVDPRWLLHFVSRESFYRSQMGLANGGRKARRVNPEGFLALCPNIPQKPEQVKIADVLDTADQEIKLLRQQLIALKQQKKGLMQKLLTGEIRVRA